MASPSLIDATAPATAGAARDFAWPDFDRWQAVFAAGRAFPDRWEGLHAAPPPRTPEAEAYQLRKLALFIEWRDMLAHRPALLAHFARQGIHARIKRQHPGPACPACDPFDTREVGPGLDTVPPFHPGCRCVLLAVHTAPALRRPRAHARSRSHAG